MRQKIQKIRQTVVIFCLGGLMYCAIELLWRGRTHVSMFFLGGACFCLVGGLGRRLPMSFLAQMTLGTLIITALEFCTGLLVNRELTVWDYSSLPYHFMGQICLPYSLLWFPLCGLAILMENKLRHILFGENMPRYRWII